jgi:hypothetical protein
VHVTTGVAWCRDSEQEPLGKYGQQICRDTGKKENKIERLLDSIFATMVKNSFTNEFRKAVGIALIDVYWSRTKAVGVALIDMYWSRTEQ